MSKKEKKLSDLDSIIENTFSHIRDIVDANTVVGDIIDIAPGLHILPISKISVGLISGGGNMLKGKKNDNINAGSGTGFNIVPIGFITIANSSFGFIPINNGDISKGIFDILTTIGEKFLIQKQNEVQDEENNN